LIQARILFGLINCIAGLLGKASEEAVGIGQNLQPDARPVGRGDAPKGDGKWIAVVEIIIIKFVANVEAGRIPDVMDIEDEFAALRRGGDVQFTNGGGGPGLFVGAIQGRGCGVGGVVEARGDFDWGRIGEAGGDIVGWANRRF
jgi:hypothetical protein